MYLLTWIADGSGTVAVRLSHQLRINRAAAGAWPQLSGGSGVSKPFPPESPFLEKCMLVSPLLPPEAQKLLEQRSYALGQSCVKEAGVKQAGDAQTVQALHGRLVSTEKNWVLLTVPNALVRGAFDALGELGCELPLQPDGRLNAHISVIRPDELASIGGKEKLNELGHSFYYTLGPVQEVTPETWDGVSKCWYIKVYSTDLQNLRKSYGLSATPKDGRFDFHITFAIRKKRVLNSGDSVVKHSEKVNAAPPTVSLRELMRQEIDLGSLLSI